MRECGLVESEYVVFHERIAYGDSTKFAGFAQQDMARLRIVQPTSDGLARPFGDLLPNMTGVTTFDDRQATDQIALLRAIKPSLAKIAHLAAAVSDCLRIASTRAA
jgi:hypothetical protein